MTTRTSRSASATLSLAAVLVAIFASSGCASRTRGPEPAASLETAPSRFATVDDPIAVPLLVVNAKSPIWTPEYVAYVRNLAPQVDYRVIEGPGHFLMLEKPQEFNAAVLDFLQKQKLLGG